MNKEFLKKIYYSGLSALQADKYKLQSLKRQNKIAVLNLHRVSAIENPFWSPLKPEIFEELLRFLQKNFEVCLFNQLQSAENQTKPLAVLSFDDGYYNFIEYALPLLEKYKMRANMNIIPQCAESGKPIWNVRLYDFLNSAPRGVINEIRLPDFDGNLTDDSRQAKLNYGLRISSYLKKRPRREREEIWQLIEPFLAKADFEQTRMMTTNEIREIAGETEIGVHSFSHESMGFEENDFFIRDFAGCRNYFAEKLNLPLTIYAFPNGSYRAEQVDFLRRNDIKHILLVDEKFADSQTDVLPRLTVYGNTQAEIKMKSLGF
ncbi:MAG: polysaccharide deacetylase family protein [Pyrinomonadaceae bacterium]